MHIMHWKHSKISVLYKKDEFYGPNNQVEIVLRMHDHLRDLGREMAHELSPPHRLWRPEDIKSLESLGFKTIFTKTNVRCFNSIFDESMGAQVTSFLGQSDSCLETSASLLWLQIEGNSTALSSIPSWIPLQKLQCLIIKRGRFKTLWENGMQEDWNNGGISYSGRTLSNDLKNLEIRGEQCVSNILINAMHYPSVQSIKLHYMKKLVEADLRMVKTLNCLEIKNCKNLKSVSGISDLENLVELKISHCGKVKFESLCLRGMKYLKRISFDRNVIVKSFELDGCQNLIAVRFSCQRLVELRILGCPKLKKMPNFTGPSCLERIIIDECRIQDLVLYNCKNLESVSGISNLAKLVELEISDCGMLEFESLCLRGMMCLERISFDRNVVVKCFELNSCQNLISARFCCERLIELRILGCRELKEIPDFTGLSCLERIIIDECGIQDLILYNCKTSKSVSGISNLAKLVELEISDCGKLEFESLCLRSMKCLERISFDRNVVVKCFELDGCENLISARFCCEKLVELRILSCPKLKEIPDFTGLSCLERIIIDGCEIQYLILENCQNLESVSTNLQFIDIYNCPELEELLVHISDCPELEELQSVPRLSSLIVINSCEKLENIAGIEELHVPQYMKLWYCSNALIRNCIHKMKSLRSVGIDMIGRPVDGAESNLNNFFFCGMDSTVERVIEIGSEETHSNLSELRTIIVCLLVVVDSSSSVEDINKSLPHDYVYGPRIRQGEWIITMVTYDPLTDYHHLTEIQDIITRKGILKKGIRVEVKKGEDWKCTELCTIVDRLYH